MNLKKEYAFFLLFFFVTNVLAQTKEKPITISFSNIPLSEAIQKIESVSKYTFFYDEKQIDLTQIVSLKANKLTISQAVTLLLSKTGLKFEITDSQIALYKKTVQKTLLPTVSSAKGVSGIVVDENNEPIIGASIKVEGLEKVTISGLDGRFNLDIPLNSKLNVSFIGYISEVVSVSGKSYVKITLRENTKAIDEVVVVGYGTQKKVSLTGSIAMVKGNEIVATKNENVTNMLAGKLPGVRVIQTSGEPGSFASSIQIRGMGTPLIIIDGVPRDNMSRIDPNEIESISVLKDASAAIYGVRASNGIILITTKKGADGKPQIEYSTYYGIQTPINTPKGLNALQYMEITNENEIMRGSLPYGQLEYSQKLMAKYKSGALQGTDWASLHTNYYAPQYKQNISASGSVADKINYFINFSYLYQDGVYSTNDLNYDRYNLRSNISAKVTDNLKAELLINGVSDTKNSPYGSTSDYWRAVWCETPITKAYANNNTNYLQNISQGYNPLALSNSDIMGYKCNKQKTFQSTGNLIWDIPFVKGLQGKASYSYDYIFDDDESLQKPYALYDYDAVTKVYSVANYGNTSRLKDSYVSKSANMRTNTLMQVSLNYQGTFSKKHNLALLALYEEGYSDNDNFQAGRYIEMTSIQELFGGTTDGQIGTQDANGVWETANKALVGRVNYNFDSKYYAEFAFRYDGSSKFAPGHQWGFFPSVSAAWRLSEEPFIKENLFFVDNLKLRGSYGVTGDDATATFQFIPGFNYPVSSYDWWPTLFDNQAQSLLSLRQTPNTNLTWYTSKTYDVGMDADLWHGLLSFEGDLFLRNRDGLVATRAVSLPDWLGESLAGENINSDQTLGFDLSLKHRNKIGSLTYGITGNLGFTRTKNRYVEREANTNQWDNWRNNTNNRYTDIWWGYDSPGQFQSYEDIWSSPFTDSKGNSELKPGDYKYTDWNGDGVIDDLDKHPITYGTTDLQNIPTVSYGFSIDAQYHGFDMTMLLQGGALSNVMYSWYLSIPFIDNKNGPNFFYDRWHMQDPTADPKDPRTKWVAGYLPTTSQGSTAMSLNSSASTSSIHRTDYLRCKSLELGYTIPHVLGIKNTRIYCSAYNLFTITGLKYLDPEHPSSGYGLTYPLIRTINFGASLKF